MISEANIKQALQTERRYWRNRPRTPHIDGIVLGLMIADQVIQNLPRVRLRKGIKPKHLLVIPAPTNGQ